MKFKKGDIVLVKASVYTKERVASQCKPHIDVYPKTIHTPEKAKDMSRKNLRKLYRIEYKKPFQGIVTGWSTRLTGIHQPSWNYDDVGYIKSDKAHKVIMVQSMDTQRWLKPMPCLEKDLEWTEE